MTAASGPLPLRRADAAAIAEIIAAGTLTGLQNAKLAAMARKNYSRLEAGRLLKDGTLCLQGMPGEQQGRKQGGTWTAYPQCKDGQYWRMLNYRIHPDGRTCSLPHSTCGHADCNAMRDADRYTAAQAAATRAAMQKKGGSTLIPSTLAAAAQAAAKKKNKQAAAATTEAA